MPYITGLFEEYSVVDREPLNVYYYATLMADEARSDGLEKERVELEEEDQ